MKKLSDLLLGLREEDFYEIARPREELEWIERYRGWTIAAVGWGLAPTASKLTRADLTLASSPSFSNGYLSELNNPYDDFGSAVTAAMRLDLKLKDELAIVSDVTTGMRGVCQYYPGDRIQTNPSSEELILVADNLPKDLDKELELYGEVSRDWSRLEDATVLIIRTDRKLDADDFSKASMLKLIITATHGLDHIDIEEARRRAIIIERAPVRARAVAELALGIILALVREIAYSDRKMRELEWVKGEVRGFELAGRRAGVISMGIVGREVAEVLRGIGMHVDYYDKYKMGGRSLERVLRESDIIVLTSPLTEETRGLIGRKEIAMMKDGAILVNVGRGELLDLDAALEALEVGKLGGLGLDVYSKEPPFGDDTFERLRRMNNVILTPHLGGSSEEAERRIVSDVLRIMGKWFGRRSEISEDIRILGSLNPI